MPTGPANEPDTPERIAGLRVMMLQVPAPNNTQTSYDVHSS